MENQTSIKVHHWSSLLDLKGFKNPSPSPVALHHKDPCFLPIDGVYSLLDTNGNSILGILVLHRHPLLCHTDYQHPRGLTNIPKARVFLLYIKGISEKISRACRLLSIQTSFSSRNTLRKSFTKRKDQA